MREWFPELIDPMARSRTHDAIDAHRTDIEKDAFDQTVTTVHQRLRDEHDLTVGITSFGATCGGSSPRLGPGSWPRLPARSSPRGGGPDRHGYLGTWFDPVLERLRRVWAFVAVLACSRHMFVRPVLKLDQRTWTACHVAAFSFFGGFPRRLVTDNLSTGVDRADLYDPELNQSYGDLAAHYGCLIDPARAPKPKEKPPAPRVQGQALYPRPLPPGASDAGRLPPEPFRLEAMRPPRTCVTEVRGQMSANSQGFGQDGRL